MRNEDKEEKKEEEGTGRCSKKEGPSHGNLLSSHVRFLVLSFCLQRLFSSFLLVTMFAIRIIFKTKHNSFLLLLVGHLLLIAMHLLLGPNPLAP